MHSIKWLALSALLVSTGSAHAGQSLTLDQLTLGGSTVMGVGTTAGTVAAGNDSRFSSGGVQLGVVNTWTALQTFSAGIGAGISQTSTLTSRPSPNWTQGNPTQVFSGDFSHTLSTELFTTSQPVLGAPTVYQYTTEAEPHVTAVNNLAGWNQSTGDQAGGRTGFNAYDVRGWQRGGGDFSAYFASMHVGSTRASQPGGGAATYFLANPAVQVLGGLVAADPAGFGAYLQGYEIHLTDNFGPGTGTQSAGIGGVFDLNRQIATNTLGEVWGIMRGQSTGSTPSDFGYTCAGTFKVCFDTTPSTLSNQAAFTIARNQRIYWDASSIPDADGIQWFATTTGDTYQTFDGTTMSLVVAGNPTLQVKAAQVVVAGSLIASGPVTMPSINGMTTPLSVAQGGTGATVAGATAAHNIGAVDTDLSNVNLSSLLAVLNTIVGTLPTVEPVGTSSLWSNGGVLAYSHH